MGEIRVREEGNGGNFGACDRGKFVRGNKKKTMTTSRSLRVEIHGKCVLGAVEMECTEHEPGKKPYHFVPWRRSRK